MGKGEHLLFNIGFDFNEFLPEKLKSDENLKKIRATCACRRGRWQGGLYLNKPGLICILLFNQPACK